MLAKLIGVFNISALLTMSQLRLLLPKFKPKNIAFLQLYFFIMNCCKIIVKLSYTSIFAHTSHSNLYEVIYSFLVFIVAPCFKGLLNFSYGFFCTLVARLLKLVTAFHINRNMHSEISKTFVSFLRARRKE